MQADTKRGSSIAIIGAGPAGLTAAYLLARAGGFTIDVFESDPDYVGGISRTESYKGFLFDIGGHRFFSKSKEVEDFWTEILGDELLERPRRSRIYYRQKFFNYPLKALDALHKLGPFESMLCLSSYLKARLFPVKEPRNFEDWVSNKFGKRLFRIFFKTYTEKVWGIDCREISADWAAQRIKGLSLGAAMRNAVFSSNSSDDGTIKTLIDSFRYPKYGPGQMWETCREKAEMLGVTTYMGRPVTRLEYVAGKWDIEAGTAEVFRGYDHVISTAALRQIIPALGKMASPAVQAAAAGLHYRDFITVVLILKDRHQFDDNWLYIHDPAVKVGRIQNFKSWSPYMVPDATMVCYGLEYFCNHGDELWNAGDDELTALAKKEMAQIGLAAAEEILDSYVVRQPRAYPVYDHNYQQHLAIIRQELQQLKGFIVCGRNGMHKYNNQDHSMMTAMLAVKNIIAGKNQYDLWKVNQDAEYHETGERGAEGGRGIPQKIAGLTR